MISSNSSNLNSKNGATSFSSSKNESIYVSELHGMIFEAIKSRGEEDRNIALKCVFTGKLLFSISVILVLGAVYRDCFSCISANEESANCFMLFHS